jgi:hypothetical protein
VEENKQTKQGEMQTEVTTERKKKRFWEELIA